MPLHLVLDTNVLVAGLRSRRGASFALLARLARDEPGFQLHVSVPLVFEYEDALRRLVQLGIVSERDVEAVLDFLCLRAAHQDVFYLWRPTLSDPRDDMVLEVAVAAGVQYLVTFNARDFVGAERFGITVATPRDVLALLDRAAAQTTADLRSDEEP